MHINDRRLLRGMLESFGFAPQALDTVCVTFDKLDKVGPQGVAAELEEKAMPAAAVQALEAFLEKGAFSLDDVSALCADKSLGGSVRYVLDTVGRLSGGRYAVEYTPSLVRGQGYYTGMVFEVTCAAFSGAVAGGGRYDDMVGKFLGQKVPAVGFSIGFVVVPTMIVLFFHGATAGDFWKFHRRNKRALYLEALSYQRLWH